MLIFKRHHSLLIKFTLCVILFTNCSSINEIKDKVLKKKTSSIKIKKAPPVQSGPDAGDGSFLDKSSALGLDQVRSSHNYIVDFNGDGLSDLVLLPNFYSVPEFYVFNGKRFDKIVYNPFPEVSRASFLVFEDFNKDHILDVIVGTLNQKTELIPTPLKFYLGKIENGKIYYELVKDAFPLNTYPTAAVNVFDFDLDGNLDLYLANWYEKKKGQVFFSPDKIYKGDGKKFTDVSHLLEKEQKYDRDNGVFENASPSFSSSICDIDKNGYPDVLTTSSSGYGNKLWLNLSNKSDKSRIFKNYGESSKYSYDEEGQGKKSGGNSFFSLCADYNQDGIFDIAVGELFHSYDPEEIDRSAILTGEKRDFPPSFIRTEYHMDDGTGRWTQGDRRGNWADLNNDGLIDLLIDNSGFPPKSRLVFFKQSDDHSFENLAKEVGLNVLNPAGTVVLDLNRDGLTDILTGQSSVRNANLKPRVYYFENQMKNKEQKSIKIFLQGEKANLRGIGAYIEVKTENRNFNRYVQYSYGPMPSQIEDGTHIGIGQDEYIKEIEVRWPYLATDRRGRRYPLIKVYQINKRVSSHLELRLYENGKWGIR